MKRIQIQGIGLLLLWCCSSWASLGDDESSIRSDKVHMKAMAHSMDSSSSCYTVHTLMINRTAVKQYVDPQTHKVFALHFSGPNRPALENLMGDYSQEFKQGKDDPEQTRTHYTHSFQIQQTRTHQLAVRTRTTSRHSAGTAVLKNSIPACASQMNEFRP